MVGCGGQDGSRGVVAEPLPEVELPQYGVAVVGNDMYLTIGYATMMQQVYLCNVTTYEEVARKLHKGIMDAGVAAKRASNGTKLVEVKGDEAGAVVRKATRGK